MPTHLAANGIKGHKLGRIFIGDIDQMGLSINRDGLGSLTRMQHTKKREATVSVGGEGK